MKKMDVVITMSGRGMRFREAGYEMPKYMIEARHKTLFEWSLISLKGFQDTADKYIFIVLNDEKYDVKQFISYHCEQLRIKNFSIIVLDECTDGQATTAMMAEPYWNKEHALLIYNIDTYVEPFEMKPSEFKGDGFIPCFKAEGTHWSFVRLSENGQVVEIKEKQRISDNCTIGAYYFKTCQLYADLYREYYRDEQNNLNGEKYVAPLYNHLLQKGGKIYISNINPSKVHVLGTPAELATFLED